jgi:hypothetical protein
MGSIKIRGQNHSAGRHSEDGNDSCAVLHESLPSSKTCQLRGWPENLLFFNTLSKRLEPLLTLPFSQKYFNRIQGLSLEH